MNRHLFELICDDLKAFANLHNNSHIASEESIRLMIQYANDKKLTTNLSLVHLNEFHSRVNKILSDSQSKDLTTHYQFFVEVGKRSELKQGDPDKIHYCALDLYIRSGKKPIAFVADHYRGYDGFYSAFKNVSSTFDIQFYISGYTHDTKPKCYQSDRISCPLFTLNHLLLSSKDESLLSLLEGINKTDSGKQQIEFDWSELPPQYMAYAQSFNLITEYIDKVKARESLDKKLECKQLIEHKFNDILTRGLTSVTVKSNPPEQGNYIKLLNNSIKYFAIKFCEELFATLISDENEYTEERLIDICYKNTYPSVYFVLKQALGLQKPEKPHPLFELAFYQAGILERLLNEPKFKQIFGNRSLLTSMQNGAVDPKKLYSNITTDCKTRKVNKELCNKVAGNLIACETLLESKQGPEHTDNIMQHLLSKNIHSLLKKSEPLELLSNKNITLQEEHVTHIEESEEKISGLVDCDNLFGNEDDLFDVPEVIVPLEVIREKPYVNKVFISRTLSNSGLFFSLKEKDSKPLISDEHVEDKPLVIN